MNDQPDSKPEKKRKDKSPVFDSMKSCAAVTGCPIEVQQQAKEDGCQAFDDHGRVRFFEVTKWYWTNPNRPLPARARKELAEAIALERENKIADGQFIDVEIAAQIHGDKMEAAFQKWDSMAPMLDKVLAEESDPVKIRKILTEKIEEVKKIARTK